MKKVLLHSRSLICESPNHIKNYEKMLMQTVTAGAGDNLDIELMQEKVVLYQGKLAISTTLFIIILFGEIIEFIAQQILRCTKHSNFD
uniref:Uncharacterized protein n=1 Tax=Romanomermis culicivorax TaxID=13658 RepID=A0A915JPP1_ROMCU